MMGYVKRCWKLVLWVLIILIVFAGALHASKGVTVLEVAGENVPVIDTVKAVVSAMVMLAAGIVVYIIRKKRLRAE